MNESHGQADRRRTQLSPLKVEVLTKAAASWLATSKNAAILHLFPSVCNLVNEDGEVLSLIARYNDLAPCSILLTSPSGDWSEDGNLDRLLAGASPITTSPNSLSIGEYYLPIRGAKTWDPTIKPDRFPAAVLFRALSVVETELAKAAVPGSLADILNSEKPAGTSDTLRLECMQFVQALRKTDLPGVSAAVQSIAGLGGGLTPSGDDFLLGAIYCMWLMSSDKMGRCIGEIVNQAAPSTTALSSTWLKAAGRQEASVKWHMLFAAMIGDDKSELLRCTRILANTGHTSGADALTGFIVTSRALE